MQPPRATVSDHLKQKAGLISSLKRKLIAGFVFLFPVVGEFSSKRKPWRVYKSDMQTQKRSLLLPSASVFERSVPNLVLNEGLIERETPSTLQMILVKYCNVLRVRSEGKTAL